MRSGYVYLASSKKYLKIGSSWNAQMRVKELTARNKIKYKLLGLIEVKDSSDSFWPGRVNPGLYLEFEIHKYLKNRVVYKKEFYDPKDQFVIDYFFQQEGAQPCL